MFRPIDPAFFSAIVQVRKTDAVMLAVQAHLHDRAVEAERARRDCLRELFGRSRSRFDDILPQGPT